LVEQATVDAYDEYEQLASFRVVIEEHLAVPTGPPSWALR
jgi:hypothetical protein